MMAPKRPQTVEYVIADLDPSLSNDELADRLNAFADQGWRLVALTGRSETMRKAWFERDK
jgi:hypothetical protein